VYDSAAHLARLLQLPIVYSVPPPEEEYALSTDIEIIATGHGPKLNLSDYSCLAPFVWVEGVKRSSNSSYLHPPALLKTDADLSKITAGSRPEGSIEASKFGRAWSMPQSYTEITLSESEGVKTSKREESISTMAKPSRVQSSGANVRSVQARLAKRALWISESQSRYRHVNATVEDAGSTIEYDETDDEF
jgi:hypothetical protein